jgi:hypothetical protein
MMAQAKEAIALVDRRHCGRFLSASAIRHSKTFRTSAPTFAQAEAIIVYEYSVRNRSFHNGLRLTFMSRRAWSELILLHQRTRGNASATPAAGVVVSYTADVVQH